MKKFISCFVICLFLLLLIAPLQGWAATYTFSPINYPGASWTDAMGINDAGQVVGAYGVQEVGQNDSRVG